MIRPFTCLCLLMAAGSGLYLYSAKHDAQVLDKQIDKLRSQARSARADASLLHAAYDRLGDPDRLRELAAQVLTLQKTDPKQFVALSDLDKRLPPVGLPVAPEPPVVETPMPEAPVVAAVVPPPAKPVVIAEKPKPVAPTPVPAAQIAQAVPAHAPAPPRPLMSVAQAAPVSASAAAVPAPASVPPPAQVRVAALKPTPLAPTPISPVAQPSRPQAPIQVAAVRPQSPVQMAAVRPPAPAPAPAPVASQVSLPPRPAFVGSALGMARYSNLANPIAANGRLASQPAASVLTPTGYQPPAMTR